MHRPTATPLVRALPYLRLPDAPNSVPTLASLEAHLSPSSDDGPAPRDGILDLLEPEFHATDAQKMLDHRWSAQLYDWARPRLPRVLGMPSFETEVSSLVDRLDLRTGDTVLDVACGQGNFTAALAKAVGPEGLVIGVDISRAMLARAAVHVREQRLENVLLIRADALHLPLADRSFATVNCSGGLHQFPDLTQAIREMGRVSRPNARITVSGFAESESDSFRRFKHWTARRFEAHFVPMDRLARELSDAGYREIGGDMSGRWVGYRWAHKLAADAGTPGTAVGES